MHATIYTARKCSENENGQLLCAKVFKPYEDGESKNCAEEEYRVS